MILYMYIAQDRDWQTLGDEILISSGTSCQLKKQISLKSDFIQFFHDFIHEQYIASVQGLTIPWGRNFDVNRTSCHFGHLLQVKKSLRSLILYSFFFLFFLSFNTCIQARGSGRSPPGDKILMSTERPYHLTHLLQVSKKSLWSLILYIFFFFFFFDDLIHVYSPGARNI